MEGKIFSLTFSYLVMIFFIFRIYTGEFFGNMKQGKGKLHDKDGSIYEGTWDANIIIGRGKMTIKVGDEKKRDGLPKKITLKVFGY
jgi:hypothetical protein